MLDRTNQDHRSGLHLSLISTSKLLYHLEVFLFAKNENGTKELPIAGRLCSKRFRFRAFHGKLKKDQIYGNVKVKLMNERIKRLHNYMEREQLDALLITLPRHVYYLTGYLSDPHERLLAAVLPRGDEPFLLVPSLDKEAAEAASSVRTIYTHSDTDNAYEVLHSLLPDKLSRLGIEKNCLTVAQFEILQETFKAEAYVNVESVLRKMRLIKSPEEITKIQKAVDMIEEVLRRGLKQVKVGVTETDLVAELEYQMTKLGADGPSFASTVLSGEKAAMPHGTPGSRKVQAGEFLLFDIGVYVEGYASDITRTFAVQSYSKEQELIYQTVLQANLAGIAASRAGAALSSVDLAARQVIEDAGYGPYFTHRVGHGLGLDVHEYPSLHAQAEDLLVEGMVFTVEPGIYLPNSHGVRIEDDVYISHEGPKVLTTFPKELAVIG